MNHKNRYVINKILFVSILIIVLIFFISGKLLTMGVENHFLQQTTEKSYRLAKSYVNRLSTATEASHIINQFLEEKLSVASQSVVRNHENIDNDLLVELAKELKVDVIYWYNPQGEIIYANTDEYLGWKAYQGHPVYDFMNGEQVSLVEDIRKDSESEIYYKYGYYKLSNGYFVQIGVLAERINKIIEEFTIEYILQQLYENRDASIANIEFIDNNLNIIARGDEDGISTSFLGTQERDVILNNIKYSSIRTYEKEHYFQIFLPLYHDSEKLGTLAIYYPLQETEELIRKVEFIGLFILAILFAVIAFMACSISKRNKKLLHLVYYDPLTNLPNKQYLIEHLQDVIKANKKGKKFLLLININNFKMVNMVYGYDRGDSILVELASKLKDLTISNQRLFRLSDDRFIFYGENYSNHQELIDLCERITQLFEATLEQIDNNRLVTLKIGVVEIGTKYKDVDKILRDVALATDNVREDGGRNYCFFNREMEEKIVRENTIEKELRKAIESNDSEIIYLEYQPQVDLKTNKVYGFEALARMNSKELGIVSPLEFIAIAEKTQLIIPHGQWVLQQACNFIKTLERKGHRDIKVAVNISPIQLLWHDFLSTTMDIIHKSGIDPSQMELEITESVFVENYRMINHKLQDLKRQGVTISIDDFGTGYSSLARIRELHVDCIKIDKYFIDKLLDENRQETMIADVIALVHRLGHRVVAEGVEEEKQKEYLAKNHCDIMQGYLFSKPIPEDKVFELLT